MSTRERSEWAVLIEVEESREVKASRMGRAQDLEQPYHLNLTSHSTGLGVSRRIDPWGLRGPPRL